MCHVCDLCAQNPYARIGFGLILLIFMATFEVFGIFALFNWQRRILGVLVFSCLFACAFGASLMGVCLLLSGTSLLSGR